MTRSYYSVTVNKDFGEITQEEFQDARGAGLVTLARLITLTKEIEAEMSRTFRLCNKHRFGETIGYIPHGVSAELLDYDAFSLKFKTYLSEVT